MSNNQSSNKVYSLESLAILEVDGAEPCKYLQGQLTADIAKVNQSMSQPSALCNIKGRIIALPHVVYWDKFYLIIPQELQQKVAKVLNKTALFSRIKIQPNTDYKIFASQISAANTISPPMPEQIYNSTCDDQVFCSKIADDLALFIVKNNFCDRFTKQFSEVAEDNSEEWHKLLLSRKIITINAETSGLFLPHRLGLQKTDYISFTKGCFVGQEIIARTQYLAKLKHDLYVYVINDCANLNPGQKVLATDQPKEIGEVIDAIKLPNNSYLAALSILTTHQPQIKLADDATVYNLEKLIS